MTVDSLMFETLNRSLDPMGRPASAERYFGAAAAQAVIIWIFLHQEMGLGLFPSVLLITIIGSLLGAKGNSLTEEYRTWVRTILAERLAALARARALGDSEFFLYLRPFSFDDSLPVNNPLHNLAPVLKDHYRQMPIVELESLLSEIVWQTSTFLKIGGNRTASGACEITACDDEWRELFLYTAEKARLILVVPSATPSCSWEIETISLKGWLQKTLLIMPPVIKKEWPTFAETWESTRSKWGTEGFELPPFAPSGALFAYDNQKSLAYCAPFPSNAKALQEALVPRELISREIRS